MMLTKWMIAVDFNLDGIPDNFQPQIIKCVQAFDGSVSIGIEKVSSSVEEIESIEVIDPDTITDTCEQTGGYHLWSFCLSSPSTHSW